MMRRRTLALFAFASAGLGVVCAGPVQADAAADFYRGRTVTIIVGSGAGGGFGLNGRLVGNHIGKHIPGNPTVVVQFMRGGDRKDERGRRLP